MIRVGGSYEHGQCERYCGTGQESTILQKNHTRKELTALCLGGWTVRKPLVELLPACPLCMSRRTAPSWQFVPLDPPPGTPSSPGCAGWRYKKALPSMFFLTCCTFLSSLVKLSYTHTLYLLLLPPGIESAVRGHGRPLHTHIPLGTSHSCARDIQHVKTLVHNKEADKTW